MSDEVKAVVRVSDAGASATAVPGARARSETMTLVFAVTVAVALGVRVLLPPAAPPPPPPPPPRRALPRPFRRAGRDASAAVGCAVGRDQNLTEHGRGGAGRAFEGEAGSDGGRGALAESRGPRRDARRR